MYNNNNKCKKRQKNYFINERRLYCIEKISSGKNFKYITKSLQHIVKFNGKISFIQKKNKHHAIYANNVYVSCV